MESAWEKVNGRKFPFKLKIRRLHKNHVANARNAPLKKHLFFAKILNIGISDIIKTKRGKGGDYYGIHYDTLARRCTKELGYGLSEYISKSPASKVCYFVTISTIS